MQHDDNATNEPTKIAFSLSERSFTQFSDMRASNESAYPQVPRAHREPHLAL